MKKWSILLGCILCSFFLSAQSNTTKTVTIELKPVFDSNLLLLSSENINSKQQKVVIASLKFYLSDLSFFHNGKQVWKEPHSYHLINVSDSSSLSISLNIPKNIDYNELYFLFGTDSITNVSGAMGGDLDPTNGMYWAWNSGYINFKMEGKWNDTPFEYHLGGYSAPNSTVQAIQLKTKSKDHVVIQFDVSAFFNQLLSTSPHKIMSPGKEAVELMQVLAKLFVIHE